MKEHNTENKNTPSEKPAVKTTIVGGRPPGSGKETSSVPRGIEILVKKASIDPTFKEALLKERAAAANRIDLSLEESEVRMLNNIPQPHLEGVISATKVSPNLKQAFLGYTAAVMLAALTATASASEDDYLDQKVRLKGTGISPDDVVTDVATRGIRPDNIIEYKKTPEPYFKKAESDMQSETGTLEIRVTDRVASLPLNLINIHFVKISNQGINKQDRTEGLGYTNSLGIYRIEGVPVGIYAIGVAENSGYFFHTEQIKITANIENLISFKLDRRDSVATKGVRIKWTYPDDKPRK